jgi:pumilio RNA-binding family
MTLESEGSSRIVQLALRNSSPHVAAVLAKGLKDNVCQAALSIHGNHVLQRIIEVLPAIRWEFLVVELGENSVEIAKNVYGCRIFCRLAEQSINSQEWQALVESILQEVDVLAQHQYGRFVVQSFLEYGTEEQKHRLAMALLPNLSDLVQNRNASHVVEKALLYCSHADREQLAIRLLYANRGGGEDTGLLPLVKTQFGGFVVKALVAMSGSIAAEARRQLALIAAKHFKDKTGSKDFRMAERLLSELQITPMEVEKHHAA